MALFYLDAHYSGGEGNCPLLEEVNYIDSLPLEMYILIKDARYALSPIAGDRYFVIQELFAILPKENYNVIINEIVISVPPEARPMIEEYCRRVTTSRQRKIKSKRVRAVLYDLQ